MTWRLDVRAVVGALEVDVRIDADAGPLVLVGPNGAGKTTLLRILAGLHPATGTLRVGDRVWLDTERARWVPPEERRVGYVPQSYALFPHLRVIDNVAFGLRSLRPRRPRSEIESSSVAMLERLECADLAGRWPSSLSGGERQRVALARALVLEPDLLLLDEPLAALDAASRRGMRRTLVELLAGRATGSVIVTHDLRDIVALDAPVVVLEQGRVQQRGMVAQLREAPCSEFVRELCDLPLPIPSE